MNIKKIISYREVWMGIAMLLVMLFHSEIKLVPPFTTIKNFGYGGVDVFFLASGIGNYYSYLKDENPLGFINRRIRRLAPVYIPFIIVWCAYSVMRGELDPLYIPGNLLGIQGFSSSGDYFNWYLTGIMICYLLTPYLASFIKKNRFLKCVILILVLVVISISFIKDGRFIISFTRIPVYAVGMLFAKYDYFEVKKVIAPLFILFVVGAVFLKMVSSYLYVFLWDYGLFWYPFLFITPFLCITISGFSMLCEKTKQNWILNCFKFIGHISFELYLIHIFVFEEIKNSMILNNLQWMVVIALVIMISFAYSKAIKRMRMQLNKMH